MPQHPSHPLSSTTQVCRRFPYAHFIVGGDGPKRAALEEIRDRHQLQERLVPNPATLQLIAAQEHAWLPAHR